MLKPRTRSEELAFLEGYCLSLDLLASKFKTTEPTLRPSLDVLHEVEELKKVAECVRKTVRPE